jgi:hypothetical protein
VPVRAARQLRGVFELEVDEPPGIVMNKAGAKSKIPVAQEDSSQQFRYTSDLQLGDQLGTVKRLHSHIDPVAKTVVNSTNKMCEAD